MMKIFSHSLRSSRGQAKIGLVPQVRLEAGHHDVPRGLAKQLLRRDAAFQHSRLTGGSLPEAFRAARHGRIAYASDGSDVVSNDVRYDHADTLLAAKAHPIEVRAQHLDDLLGNEIFHWWFSRMHARVMDGLGSTSPLGRYDRHDPYVAVLEPVFALYKGSRDALLYERIDAAIDQCGVRQCEQIFHWISLHDTYDRDDGNALLLHEEFGRVPLGTLWFHLRARFDGQHDSAFTWSYILDQDFRRVLPAAHFPRPVARYQLVYENWEHMTQLYESVDGRPVVYRALHLQANDLADLMQSARMLSQLSWFQDVGIPNVNEASDLMIECYELFAQLIDRSRELSDADVTFLGDSFVSFAHALHEHAFFTRYGETVCEWSVGLAKLGIQYRCLEADGYSIPLAYHPSGLCLRLMGELFHRGDFRAMHRIGAAWPMPWFQEYLQQDHVRVTPETLQLLATSIITQDDARQRFVSAMGHKRIGKNSAQIQRGALGFLLLRGDAPVDVAAAMDVWMGALPAPTKSVAGEWRDLGSLALAMRSNSTLAHATWAQVRPHETVAQIRTQFNKALLESLYPVLAMDAEARVRFEQSVAQHPGFWFAQNFVYHMASVASFSQTAGRQAARALLDDILQSPIVDDQVQSMQRYEYLEDILPEEAAQHWREGNRRYDVSEIRLPTQIRPEDLVFESARGARHRIFAHLEVPSSRMRGQPVEVYRTLLGEQMAFVALDDAVRGEMNAALDQYAELLRVFERAQFADRESYVAAARNVLTALRTHRRVLRDTDAERLLGTMRYLQEFLAHAGNLPRNARQVRGYIEVTDQPPPMMVRGIYPSATCQTCTNASGFNGEGQIVNPMRFGQFRLANFYDTSNGEPRLAARMMIEVSLGEHVDDVVILGDNNYDGGDPLAMIALKYGVRHYTADHMRLDPSSALYLLDERSAVTSDDRPILPIELPEDNAAIYRDDGRPH